MKNKEETLKDLEDILMCPNNDLAWKNELQMKSIAKDVYKYFEKRESKMKLAFDELEELFTVDGDCFDDLKKRVFEEV